MKRGTDKKQGEAVEYNETWYGLMDQTSTLTGQQKNCCLREQVLFQ